MFPPDTVSEPTSIVVHKWKCSGRLPHLQEHEAVISNVIEISSSTDEALEFNAKVTLCISYSAPKLQGYELVLKRLINKTSDEWIDMDGTRNVQHFSGW